MTAEDRFPSYRAPQTNREVLCVPDPDDLLRNIPTARRAIDSSDVLIAEVPLADLARDARQNLLADALRYTNSYVDSSLKVTRPGPLVITGHQPELVHPGVWLKNFAASSLAKQVNGTAINLVIDSDLCRNPSIRVPTGTAEQPQVFDIAFDDPQLETPYESRRILNQDCWRSFGERVTHSLESLVTDPLISDWWPQTPSDGNLGRALAQARHRKELQWGSYSLEIPQSRVCQQDSFRRFAAHLLGNASQLREQYNQSLADYRDAHHLRSLAQPLPDLQIEDGWVESPFWIWSDDTPLRRPLFVRDTNAGLALTDRHDWHATLPHPSKDADGCVQALVELEDSGMKIRTRALITTLYARLVLADTFIHGIGGAKYDQVTEQLCERLFGICLPQMVVLSGTLRLPIEHETVPGSQVLELRQTLREFRYHPEAYLQSQDFAPDEHSQIEELITAKRNWVQTTKTKANASERHKEIERVNQALQPWLTSQREEVQQELSRTVSQIRVNQLLESREYAFCLFPPKVLEGFLLDF